MPTKAFINPFQWENKENIAGNEKKNLHGYSYSKKYFSRVFHQAYISDL